VNFHDNVAQILNRQRYSKKVATLIAHDVDKSGPERRVHTFLYLSVGGGYFTVTLIGGENVKEQLEPVTMGEAMLLYDERLQVHEVWFLDAFPVSA